MTATLDHDVETVAPDTSTDTRGMFIHLTGAGRSVSWDRTDPASVASAKVAFDRLMDEGKVSFNPDGDNTATREFDPEARELFIVAQFAGG